VGDRASALADSAIVNVSDESPLRRVLASVTDRMVADFKGVAKHSGSKAPFGGSAPQQLSAQNLPRTSSPNTAGGAAVNGGVSRQCDITIAEPSTPPFWDEGDYRIVPAECVYGVIEVKASLDSTELEKAWRLIADVKALPKTADFPNPPNEPQRRAQRTASISSTS
jgi:hypothetical protein